MGGRPDGYVGYFSWWTELFWNVLEGTEGCLSILQAVVIIGIILAFAGAALADGVMWIIHCFT